MTAFCSKPLFMSELRDVLSQPYRVKKEETPAAPYRFEGKKVLLVEDNLLKQEIAQAVLQDAGFTVDTADDGDVAVARLQDSAGRIRSGAHGHPDAEDGRLRRHAPDPHAAKRRCQRAHRGDDGQRL